MYWLDQNQENTTIATERTKHMLTYEAKQVSLKMATSHLQLKLTSNNGAPSTLEFIRFMLLLMAANVTATVSYRHQDNSKTLKI